MFQHRGGTHPCGDFALLVNRIGQNSAGSLFGAVSHPVLRQSKTGFRRALFACRELDDMEQVKGDVIGIRIPRSQKRIRVNGGRLGHARLAISGTNVDAEEICSPRLWRLVSLCAEARRR